MNSTATNEDDIARAARGIAGFPSLKDWVHSPLRALLPHEAMLCGQSIAHSGGFAALQRWATGVPAAYQASISCVGGNFRSPILTRVIASGQPVFFDAERDGPGVPAPWLSNFRTAHWRNVLVLTHREGEGEDLLRTSASFYNVPPDIELQAPRLQDTVMPHLHAALSRIHRAQMSASDAAAAQPVVLTPAERAIVDLLLQGKTNKEIGKRLGRSDETVKHRLALLMHRLKVRNRTELVALASPFSTRKDFN